MCISFNFTLIISIIRNFYNIYILHYFFILPIFLVRGVSSESFLSALHVNASSVVADIKSGVVWRGRCWRLKKEVEVVNDVKGV